MCALITLTVVIFTQIYLCEAKSTLPTGSNCTVKDHLPCTEYNFSNETECTPANLAQIFPDLYGEEHWPGKAYSFKLVSIEQIVYNEVNYANVSVVFKPPRNVSVMSVRGFELMIYKANADRPTCIILDLSNANWTGDMDDNGTQFGVNFVTHSETMYRVELYSLPLPPLEYPDIDDYLLLNFTTPHYTTQVTLGGTCHTALPVPDVCADSNASCSEGICLCTAAYYDNKLDPPNRRCTPKGFLGGVCPTNLLDTDVCSDSNARCSPWGICLCTAAYYDNMLDPPNRRCTPKVSLGGFCPTNLPDIDVALCADSNARCSGGTCLCTATYYDNMLDPPNRRCTPTITASISWKTFEDERRVAVTFSYPPTAPTFTQFELTLRDYTSWENTQKFTVHENFYNFTNVQPGNYSIRVRPIDPYAWIASRCLCQKDAVCVTCPTTPTVMFEFTYVTTTTSTTITTATTTTSTTTEPKPKGLTATTTDPSGPTSSNLAVVTTQVPADLSDIKIIVSVLGVVLGLTLAGVGFWLYYLRNIKPERDDDTGVMQTNPGFHDDNDSMLTIDVMKKEKLTKILNNESKNQVFERVPKLFMLHEEDHEFHCGVVNSFASYLHRYCQCHVMCASWQQEASWVHQEMQQADFVVIVNSEAAYNIYKSRKGGKATIRHGGGSGSPRVASINSVLEQFLQDARYDNIIMVYFDHTAERFVLPDICPGYNYKLMKHFTDFLIHVHQLKRTDNLAQYDLPFDGNHGHRGQIGLQLIESINRCKKYEQENPKWFVQKYGMMRSCSNTSDQVDSGLEEMMASLPDTPTRDVLERPELREYTPQLDGVSQGAVTIDPPAPGQLPDTHHSGNSPPNTADSGQFEFLPPDDFMEADIMSKSESEQMKSIVDGYHWNCGMPAALSDRTAVGHGYNRDHDLALLRIQSGELQFTIDLTEPGDVHSLGGESV